jgi:multidrug efflux system membrane fusion protein
MPDASSINVRSRWWPWLTAVCAVGAALYVWTARVRSGKRPPAAPVIPVSATLAKRGNLDIYLSQIGTVTPFATVTVRSQVAGQITKLGFREGSMVAPGQLLFQIDPRPYQAQLMEYEGQLARDQATLANARITLVRYRDLFRRGVIARQDLDNQQALYDQARGAITADRGEIDAVKVNLAYCRIVSPIKGRIGLREVDLGNYVQPSDALVVITQLRPTSVIFSVPEGDIPEVVKDMRAGRVPVQAWNRDFSKLLSDGFLLTFDNEVDEATGTVKLRAQFANRSYSLFPGQFVNAKLRVRTLHGMVLVPTAAVQRTQKGSYVYVVERDKTVTRAPITVSALQGDITAVIKGVKAGDVVVTDGLDRLRPGARVAVRMEGSPSTVPTTLNQAQNLADQ